MPFPFCEVRVFSRRHRYAGTLDLLGVWHGTGALIDYKTGDPADVAADLQTAAYYGALLEMRANGDRAEAVAFDELQHAYFIDGDRVPSVTQVLKRAGLINFDHIPAPMLIAARDRGAAVHQAVHFFNEGDLDTEQFARDFPDLWPYVAAWLEFLAQSGFRFATAADLADLTHIKRYAIRLRSDGHYSVESYNNPRDYSEFLTLLQAQHIVDARRESVLA